MDCCILWGRCVVVSSLWKNSSTWICARLPLARMRKEGYSTWSVCLCVCVSLCLCVCVSVTQHLTLHVIIHATNNSNLPSGGWRSKILSDFLWKCFVAKLERFLLVRLCDESAIFYSTENMHAYEFGPHGHSHFVGKMFFASLIIGHWQQDCKYASNKGMSTV